MVEKLLNPRYKPSQTATFWRLCDILFTERSQTRLLQKIIGDVDMMNTPQDFVKVYHRILEMKKL
jgi:hypothetical protein